MATARGGAAARRFMQELPEAFLARVLPRAGRAGGNVIAEDAKATLGDRRAETSNGTDVLIADSVKVQVKRIGSKIRVRITLEGPGAYVGRWLEYGTAPHLISVADSVRGGRSVARINKLASEGSLVIGNNFVGASVHHPGASPHPFLRPALDRREGDAIAAMQQYVTSRAARAGIAGAGGPESDA